MIRCVSPECHGFVLGESDSFCPWCGTRRPFMTCVLQVCRNNTWIDLEGGVLQNEAGAIRLVVRNLDSKSPITINPKDIVSSSSCFIVQASDKSVSIRPNGSQDFSLEFKAERATFAGNGVTFAGNTVRTANVSFSVTAYMQNGLSCQCHCSLVVWPIPEVKLLLAKDQIFDITSKDDIKVAICLSCNDNFVLLSKIQLRESSLGLNIKPVPERRARPFPINGKKYLLLPAEMYLCIPGKYTSESSTRANYQLSCTYCYPTPTGLVSSQEELTVPVEFSYLPRLVVNGTANNVLGWEVVQSAVPRSKIVSVSNSGAKQSKVTVNGAHLEPSCTGDKAVDNIAQKLAKEAKVSVINSNGRALELAGGDSGELEIVFSNSNVPAGIYCFEVAFQCEPKVAYSCRRRFTIQLDVKKASVFDGVLAIDFGTTASCAGVLSSSNMSQVVSLDAGAPGEKHFLRSVVLFKTYYSDERRPSEVDYGYYAWQAAFQNAISCVSSPKRLIGSAAPIRVTPSLNTPRIPVTLSIDEIVRIGFLQMATTVKEEISKGELDEFRPTDCSFEHFVVTHPSRFKPKQLQVLKKAAVSAFKKAFGASVNEDSILWVPEPVAAALYFLSEEDLHAYFHERFKCDVIEYKLAVYDCGGGTTDLSLITVSSSRRRVTINGAVPIVLLNSIMQGQYGKSLWRKLVGKAVARLLNLELCDLELSFDIGNTIDPRLEYCIQEVIDGKWLTADRITGWKEKTLGFTESEMRQAAIEVVEDYRNNAYHYDVCLSLDGSSGDSHFGGEDVTDCIKEKLIALINDKLAGKWQLMSTVDKNNSFTPETISAINTNDSLLTLWTELIKCGFSKPNFSLPKNAQTVRELGLTDPQYYAPLFLVGETGSKREHILDLLNGQCPGLEEIENSLAIKFANTTDYLMQLVHNRWSNSYSDNNDSCLPDVILLTGRASLWPQVRRSIAEAFQGANTIIAQNPSGLKHCVVEGAARLKLWTQQQGGVANMPGVRASLNNANTAFTISRLGFVSGGTFIECIGLGIPFSAEGNVKSAKQPWRFLRSGKTEIPIYENLGNNNSMLLAGKPNPDIKKVAVATFDIPDTVDLANGCVTFFFNKKYDIGLRVEFGGAAQWFNNCVATPCN